MKLSLSNSKNADLLVPFVVAALVSGGSAVLFANTTNTNTNAKLPVTNLADEATSFNRTSSAYEEAPPNLGHQAILDHDAGDEAFEEIFVSTENHPNSGLGPVFNNLSCVSCHIRNGRGMPETGQLLLRISNTIDSSEIADIGSQIQDFSVAGVQSEASIDIQWVETPGRYPDGTEYSLRKPLFKVILASTGELLPAAIPISARIPPPVHGLGLLEAIADKDILALADPTDSDADGISGKANRVWSHENNKFLLGRFGWKANSPTLLQQSAEAYFNDMGISSSMFPNADGSVEISDEKLLAAASYAQTLAVPARHAVSESEVLRGAEMFDNAGCNACHVDSFTTSNHKYPALENQAIKPYTDLLLHDMGEGLADYREDFEASGREWRTPPLWGIGLAQTVLPYSGYLHDGRARSFEEAILWHGGEADASRLRFIQMPKPDRHALAKFLQSL